MLEEQIGRKSNAQKFKKKCVNTSAAAGLEVLSRLVPDQQKQCRLGQGWNYCRCCRCQTPGASPLMHLPVTRNGPSICRACLEGRWQGSLENGVYPCNTWQSTEKWERGLRAKRKRTGPNNS